MEKQTSRDTKKRDHSLGGRFESLGEDQDSTLALAVGCYPTKDAAQHAQEHIEELIALAESCQISVLESRIFLVRTLVSSTYLNEGKLLEIEAVLQKFPTIGTLLIDEEITASQQRNLEKRLKVAVLDRTELILEIFAERAFTAEAGLQVELARAKYLLPRLKRMWGHLSRQKSGSGGGFVKGEGEKQIELDRRMVKERIHKLSVDLKQVEKQRKEQQKAKKRRGVSTFALIGYTNSGKSTLLNALTHVNTYAEDKLFATLDPKTCRCSLPNGQQVLVMDTVGLIRKLPHTLVAAFKSTLEAALHEDFLLHVVDASHPAAMQHVETTNQLLKELQIKHPKIIHVLNKIDRLPNQQVPFALRLACPNHILVSARSGEGVHELLQSMETLVQKDYLCVSLAIPYHAFDLFTRLQEEGVVVSHQLADNEVIVEARLPKHLEHMFANYITFYLDP